MASLLTEEDLVLLDRTQNVRKNLITKLDTYYANKEHIGSKDLESFVGLLDRATLGILRVHHQRAECLHLVVHLKQTSHPNPVY